MAGAITNKLGNVVVMPVSSMRQADDTYDIGFSANDTRKWSVAFYNDGIAPYTDDLSDGAVKWVNGFTVRVNPFSVNIDGTLCFYDEALSFALEEADAVLPRIDSVVVRRDLFARRADLYIKQGTPAAGAVPPELEYNRDGVCEFLLANVYVTAGVGSLAQSDVTDWRKFMTVKAGTDGNVLRYDLGEMMFTGFTPAELPVWKPGWYFMNGDYYPNTSKQAIQLNKLPTDFKERWGIINNGSATCVPNFFYEDGRGYFVRAVNGISRLVASAWNDAMRPIKGSASPSPQHGYFFRNNHVASGAFTLGPQRQYAPQGATDYQGNALTINTELLGPNFSGVETRPVCIGMLPVIYLTV